MVPSLSEFLSKCINIVTLFLYFTPFKSLGPFLNTQSIEAIGESLEKLPLFNGENSDRLQEFMSTLSISIAYSQSVGTSMAPTDYHKSIHHRKIISNHTLKDNYGSNYFVSQHIQYLFRAAEKYGSRNLYETGTANKNSKQKFRNIVKSQIGSKKYLDDENDRLSVRRTAVK